jgi:hypothetical protein
MVSDLYFVAILKQLLRRNLCAVQKRAVCGIQIVDVIFDAICLNTKMHYLRVLPRSDFISQDEISL